ncbi:LamG-like jellyroll fold domain-containing protein [Anaerorhabdus sp.]|uniref:LamG-like jellyroll fold domain-containing protein n=1 Tax=Anaerorhabdus sp. TaxID=1872524 RepID=UPI002B20EAED|nr:LamG-like jellyroll fold domain-containing protein [Anaerorhabdus sp.]MEA4874391.1 LamG-like jellyroll fold domain-containing protein [Anaerorhabdus sp.]
MKKLIITCIICCLLSGCSNRSNMQGTIKVSLDNENLDLWQAQKIDDSIMITDNLLGNKSFSISFWIKPTTNKTGTILFTIGNDSSYIQLTTSGSSETPDGIEYSGLTLESKRNMTTDWVIADGNITLQTGKFNYVVTQFNDDKAIIYLNGEKVAEGNLKLSYTENTMYFGRGLEVNSNKEEGYVSDLIVSNKLLNDNEVKENYKKNYGNVILDSITFSSMDDVTNAPWLMDIVIDNIPITWKSSNPEVMDTYAKLASVDKDTIVTMTATIDYDGIKATKDFEFTVRARTNEVVLNRDLVECDSTIQRVIHSGFALPKTFSNGSLVTWSILNGEAEISNDKIIKNSINEKEVITLQAKLEYENKIVTKSYEVILLDKVAGYILSYFNGELGEETGKLAYSLDALHWTDLNDGNSIISSELGNGRIRDPFITRDKDGNFVILATEGFDNPYIYIMHSNDLIDFSNQELVRVAYFDEALQMTGKRAWAPEMTYDIATDQYYIYFSDPGDNDMIGHIYAVTTKDFVEFSYPYSFYNPGYNVIDGTVLPLDGKYWLFYKDERKAAQTIFFASTNNIANGFGLAYDDKFIFNQKFIEGPFVAKVEDEYILYVDYFPQGKFYVSKFTKLGSDMNFEWLDESEYILPNEDVRHGSIIPVTQNELDKIVTNYNK